MDIIKWGLSYKQAVDSLYFMLGDVLDTLLSMA